MVTTHPIPITWDIFCKVVDNYGDAGVCWRLAKILHHEHGLHVRLWIDDLSTLRALVPALDMALPVQDVEGVRVCCWSESAEVAADATAVIEAFGCGLPDAYVGRMAASALPPLWIVLEYLSAESWVDTHHGLASPHPQLSLTRYFFFPGFTPATGGLLCEADLLARRDAFDAASRRAFWNGVGFAVPEPSTLTVSLFAYADAPIAGLLAAMAEGSTPVVAAVPSGQLTAAVRTFFGAADDASETAWRRGALEVRALPFLSQTRYDELLWSCDINFVRGEDSLVRALWAARPLVWQPYRQEDGAHQRKMEAFLAHYGVGLDTAAADAMQSFWQGWNDGPAGEAGAMWPGLCAMQGVLASHAGRRGQELQGLGQMSARLVEFVRNKVE